MSLSCAPPQQKHCFANAPTTVIVYLLSGFANRRVNSPSCVLSLSSISSCVRSRSSSFSCVLNFCAISFTCFISLKHSLSLACRTRLSLVIGLEVSDASDLLLNPEYRAILGEEWLRPASKGRLCDRDLEAYSPASWLPKWSRCFALSKAYIAAT